MAIISVKDLQQYLNSDADDTDNKLTLAVNNATAFVNTWTRNQYDAFENYDTTNNVARAPQMIATECVLIAKAYYLISIGQADRDGSEEATWQDFLDDKRIELKLIEIQPEWKTQTISLSADDTMIIGDTDGGVGYPQILPFNARVESGASNIWVRCTDFSISKGGKNDDEYLDAWYLRGVSSDLEGTLHYQQTYRNDTADYMMAK